MTPSIVFLGGPSGAGKTTTAGWAADEFRLLFLEVDRWDANGIEFHRLRAEWDEFWNHHRAEPLAAVLRSKATAAGRAGTILSFPSHAIFTREKIAAAQAAGIQILILYGPAAACRNAFLARERVNGRGLGIDHWNHFNHVPHRIYGGPEYTDVRIDAFLGDGSPLPKNELVTRLDQCLRRT